MNGAKLAFGALRHLFRDLLDAFLDSGDFFAVLRFERGELRSLGDLKLGALGLNSGAVGFGFEVVGDYQLERFKAEPSNRGHVLDRGLWRYTRHPNYFGDATLWWGLYAIAAATPGGWLTLLSPALMTFLLMRVSGVTLLEDGLKASKPGYRAYIARTPAFFPWFPRAPK